MRGIETLMREGKESAAKTMQALLRDAKEEAARLRIENARLREELAALKAKAREVGAMGFAPKERT